MGNVTLTLEHMDLLCYVQQFEFKEVFMVMRHICVKSLLNLFCE